MQVSGKKVHLLRNVGCRSLSHNEVWKKRKLSISFMESGKKSWEISIELGRGFERTLNMKRESRFHTRATNTFTRKTRSLSRRYSTRRARLRFFEGDSTPGRNKRFDLCPLAVSLRDDLWIVARSFHLTSFRVLLCTSWFIASHRGLRFL